MNYFIIIISIIIITYCTWSEILSQDLELSYCNNKTTKVDDTDNIYQTVEKITDTIRKNSYAVGWRRAIIIAVIFTVLLLFFFECCSFINYILSIFILFSIVYFGTLWFQYRWIQRNNNSIERELYKLL